MLRSYLGNIGHLLTILAFISSLIATYAYWQSSQEKNQNSIWKKFANQAFAVHSVFVIGVVATLFSIIFNNYFEYHYAWDNTSISLPLGYAISSFWQDQEGSFLLWIFWNALVGLILIYQFHKSKKNYALASPSMMIIAGIQAFLTSMILGVVLFGETKLGSSPFLTLKELNPNLPIWSLDPDFIPKDGNGLNPLLQNYWMVIHPPTLFLGFALTMVPFAFAIASLWKKDYHGWLNITLPWSLVGAVILGTGIMMGGIWAYETLNFEGYWNWDPVENAVYVPWILLVAAFHTLFLARKSSSALKYSYILVIAQFILILYSTFLTRSGILGNASVHSFTDLGLSGQLLVYLLSFTLGAIILSVLRWKELPKDENEASIYSAEFWIVIGVLVLSLAAFQVIVTTSIPVYNSIADAIGIDLNMALPTNQIAHYTGFQMWLFILAVVLMGVAQYFWWKKVKGKNIKALVNPLIISLLLTAFIISTTHVDKLSYIILVTASVFGLVANASILLDLLKGKIKVAGGAITHIGVALMLLGIMYSSAYQKTISINNTGTEIFSDSEKESRENVLLWLNRDYPLSEFDIAYKGQFVDVRQVPGYIEKRFVQPVIGTGFKGIARADIVDESDTLRYRGDTIEYEAENTYYRVSFEDKKSGETFNLFPRFQINEQMGNVASPDIKRLWNKDIYSHVSYVQREEDREWSMPMEYQVALKDTFFLNDYVAILEDVVGVREVDGMEIGPGDAAAMAYVRILERDGEKMMSPTFVIKDNQVWSKPVVSNELGLRIQLSEIDPVNGQFSFSIARSEREYIVLKAIEKPFINLLWLGILLLVIGMFISAYRRFSIAFRKA
ncbi:cytochrome c biogenesis protein CcsA [Jiulongibacter sediminis]|uniref:Cytochrome C biogenesis protein n=1 Tax=Jiulongibacter sediminis TaxID=1605367 RepID=A0A0P7BRZ5_9BACT|nr:cytochrome c biogenesis protein CcsA [Jiulongibacter sediminis]KPM47167.1 cytochrome C biogenesis protein [Jiulongibacter sediminis]TBX22726.1 cytochrome C biogenesis protein [Jiulongibacter sediminis]